MLEEVLTYIHNWYPDDVAVGDWEVKGGSLDLPNVDDGQYFRIVGSTFNDGLHKAPAEGLHDEAFHGGIWALAVPPALVRLADEIAEWVEANGKAASSPYSSESFGGYSYSVAGGNEAAGSPTGWQRAFASRLQPYRKL